jgi:hypothetical protein
MIPEKVREHLEEYVSQEVYVQIAVIKGKEKAQPNRQLINILAQIILRIYPMADPTIILLMD